MKFLLLWLEAPLQSWGFDSRFDLRQTNNYPTMSGIYGILLASSGDSGPQCELLERMKGARFTAFSFDRPESESPSQLRDYHMIGSGYDHKDSWENHHIPKKLDGKAAGAAPGQVYGGIKQTYRYYLQDKKFAVILGLEDDLAEKFGKSLQAPVFDLYLGRKCCVPTDFIFRGCFGTGEEAKACLKELAEAKGLVPGKCFRPAAQEEQTDDAFFIRDVPLEFGEHKRYADRCIMIEDFNF